MTRNNGSWVAMTKIKVSGKWKTKRLFTIGRVSELKKCDALEIFNDYKKNNSKKSRYSNITIDELIRKFNNHLNNKFERHEIRLKTLQGHRHHLKAYICYFDLNGLKPRDLENYEVIEEFKAWLDKHEKLSNRSKDLVLLTLQMMIKFAIRTKYIEHLPLIDKYPRTSKSVDRLSKEEIKRVINNCPNDDIKFYILLCLLTGCRPAEIKNLKWDDVNWVKQTISIWPTTRNKSGRQIPIHPMLKGLLKENKNSSERISPYKSADSTRHSFGVIQKRTGIKVNSYILRKTFSSLLSEGGVETSRIALISGNSPVVCNNNYLNVDGSAFINEFKLLEIEFGRVV